MTTAFICPYALFLSLRPPPYAPLLRRHLSHIPPVHLPWRVGGLDSCKWLQNFVGMNGAFGDDPGVAGLKQHFLPLEVQLGTPFDHVAHGFILTLRCRFRPAGRLVLPKAHRNMHTRRQVLQVHLTLWRMLRSDFRDTFVTHIRLLPLVWWCRSAIGRQRLGFAQAMLDVCVFGTENPH